MIANITEWLDASTERYPDRLAIVDECERVTFALYRAYALAVARALIGLGIGARRPIAIYLKKSARVLVSFAGTAYAGCFYSPIDVEMPEARAKKILDMLEPAAVITDRAHEAAFRALGFTGPAVIYDEAEPAADDFDVVRPVRDRSIDTDLLYVLFTSGSTGTPKGVCIAHRSVIDYTDHVVEEFGMSAEDSFANQAPFSFDMSVLDIFCALASGASLYIVPRMMFMQPVRLLEYLKEHAISTISWVPSALAIVSKTDALRCVDLSATLRRVLFCGEVMHNKQLNIWRRYLPDCVYVNFYGPTEATHACTYYIVDREFGDDESLPIGRAVSNESVILLDENDTIIDMTDVSACGELCVRGTCLSYGYYNDHERTAGVFVQDPTNHAYEEKIYRTGDMARYNERGELMYVGRKDFQIKHMGHRIELGEIETAASAIPHVDSCCCVYDMERSKIVLFVQGAADEDRIKEALKDDIPHYMIPSRVVKLDAMPLNANGKIDRTRLKEMI